MRNLLSWIKAHPYSLWVTYYIPYLICFILLEQFSDPKFIIYSPIDDMIPFCEYFIIFYLMWFPLMFPDVHGHEHLAADLCHRAERP